MINRESYPYIQDDHLAILAVCYRSHQAVLNNDERLLLRLYKDALEVYDKGVRAVSTPHHVVRSIESSSTVFATAIDERSGAFVQLAGPKHSADAPRPRLVMTAGAMWSTESVDPVRGNNSTKTWS